VLLADDHAVVRDGLRLILETQPDIKVVGTASDGREAIHLAQTLEPDLVILDISMPELNGIEAAHRIYESSCTRIIMLSMHSSSEYVCRSFQAGALGYVLKDEAATELVSAIRAVNNGQRYLSHKLAQSLGEDYINQHQMQSPLESLSNREREVLQLTVEGKTSAEISVILELSAKTIETYRSRLMNKLGLHDIPSLVKFAIQHGLTDTTV
jgi:DNA-binding NarL/FixJ family response regulator